MTSNRPEEEITVEALPDVKTGKSDWRDYRAFRLPNGVTCMVVQDKESKTTGVACSVDTGAAADPRSLSGLAHFCEHMCMLGSEKYPVENEYKRFLSAHGGRSNGATSLHYTTYQFEILATHAEHAIDIFSNFFTAPLFTASCTSREVQAVDSENSKNLVSDARRRFQIQKALGDPTHYYTKFSTGNAMTLPAVQGEKTEWVREALLAFHRHHYQPENMTVVATGPQSLDTLQEWIVPRFGSVRAKEPLDPNHSEVEKLILDAAKDLPNYAFSKPLPPYNPAFSSRVQGNQWPVMVTLKPLRPLRKISFFFPLPPVRHIPNRSPTSLLSHLLGHEGKGSAFAVLQNAGLLTSLWAGCDIVGPDQSLFQLEINLSVEGESRWDDVAAIVFYHIRLILETARKAQEGQADAKATLERIWGEKRKLAEMRFNQSSPGNVYSFSPSLAQSIVSHGTEQCLCAGSLLEEDIPLDELVEFASLMTPENCFLERCSTTAWDEMEASQKLDNPWGEGFGKLQEKWYEVDYYLTPIPSGIVEHWKTGDHFSKGLDPSQISIPEPNRFIPRTLELCPELPEEAKEGPRIEKEMDPPNLVINDPTGRLWHRLDDRYALPKASITFLIRNADVQHKQNEEHEWKPDVESSIRSTMLTSLFTQAMAQDTYDAHLAGLEWSISSASSGIRFSCQGYSDRLADLAMHLLGDFLFPPSENDDGYFFRSCYFDSVKDRVVRNLRTYFQSRRADSQAVYFRDFLMSVNEGGVSASLGAAEATTLEMLKEHHSRILRAKEMEIDCLYIGNVSEKEAKKFYSKASEILHVARGKASGDLSAGESPLGNWVPGPDERRVEIGHDIELHFASQNPEEENGAALITFQSQVPGFKGEGLSEIAPESLKSSAAVRLLSTMLREPLFYNLRTQQQLGYIVQAYFDIGFASRPPDVADEEGSPLTTPIDFLVINVLSKKVAPPELVKHIDDFLVEFRQLLLDMPESEIRDRAEALSEKILKPIQKLSSESSIVYGKIRRYGPEVLRSGDKNMAWDNAQPLSRALGSLTRDGLVEAWDRLVRNTHSRSRVVSLVYGKTFSLEETLQKSPPKPTANKSVIVNDVSALMRRRAGLKAFDNTIAKPTTTRALMSSFRQLSTTDFSKIAGELPKQATTLVKLPREASLAALVDLSTSKKNNKRFSRIFNMSTRTKLGFAAAIIGVGIGVALSSTRRIRK